MTGTIAGLLITALTLSLGLVSSVADPMDACQADSDVIESYVQAHSAQLDASGEGGSVYRMTQDILNNSSSPYCCASKYYTIGGGCNNLQYPLWGAAFQPFVRILDNDYNDGQLVPRVYSQTSNSMLPSPRWISTRCVKALDDDGNLKDLSSKLNQNVMQFGQYFSHDLGLTPVMDGLNCCALMNSSGLHPDIDSGDSCFPIKIPDNDRWFQQCMSFTRSVYTLQNGVGEQVNSATHFIDQSTVYGSTRGLARDLREYVGGRLRTDGFDLLPNDGKQKCLPHEPIKECPSAGDNRASVFPGLTATHALFLREHNRVAGKLAEIHPEWNDERLYQEARAIVIAETQDLVYSEYLKVILGLKVWRFFGLHKRVKYDESVNPTIINGFQTAAFRFGHSQINNIFRFKRNSTDPQLLETLFFRPHNLIYNGTDLMAEIFSSLMSNKALNVDNHFAHGVTDELFVGVDAPGHSTDLVARNIQRGRDHGLPPYLAYRHLALQEFHNKFTFNDPPIHPCLTKVYGSDEDIDLFIGAIAEPHKFKAQVGPTFAYLIGLQFKLLREGDRLFFDSEGSNAGFTEQQIKSIKATSFSGIICRNTGLEWVAKSAFHIPSRTYQVLCNETADIDFSLW